MAQFRWQVALLVHQRGELTTPSGTLYYFSNPVAGVVEELAPGGTQWNTYLAPYGHIVAEMFTTGGTTTPYYFTGDHLTSTTALTEQNGNEAEYDSYDAWGARRLASGVDKATGCNQNPSPPSKTTRGFTSQEELDKLCLVNLNARLYDPALGRMLSGDPTVPEATNGQAFNRYSYAFNQPLSLSDPSGLAPTKECGSLNDNACDIVYIGGNGQGSDGNGNVGGANGLGYFGGDANCYIGDGCGGSPFGGQDLSQAIFGDVGMLAFGGLTGGGGFAGFSGEAGGHWIWYGVGTQGTDGGTPFSTWSGWSYAWIPNENLDSAGWLQWNGIPGGGYSNDPRQWIGTLEIGYSLAWSTRKITALGLGGSYSVSFGVAFDTQLDVGAYFTWATGPSVYGASEDTGGTVQVSNAATIDDLAGPFDQFTFGGGDALGGGVDYFWGNSPNGLVQGGGFTGGEGEGFSGSDMYTNTYLCTTSQGCH